MSSDKDIEDQRARMDPMILQQIEKMEISEKCKLLERLKALIAKKMAGSALAGTPKRCPRCKSLSFYCKGHDAHGLKRWKCCSCGKTFFVKTGSVLAMSKLTATTWAAYVKGTLAGMTLKGACRQLPCEP